MKRLSLVLAILTIAFSCNLLAQSYIYTYTIQKPKFKHTSDGYTEIHIDGCYNTGEEGKPFLPALPADLLLPQGTETENVEVVSLKFSEVIRDVKIKPASRPFPISKGAPEDYVAPRDEDVYNAPGPYPARIISENSTQFLAGHPVASFLIHPVAYFPLKNQVKILQEISVRVTCKPSGKASAASRFLKNDHSIQRRLQGIIDNQDFLNTYSYPDNRDYPEYDILLITNNDLLPYFQEYIEFKTSTGFLVKTMTTEDIYASFSGIDDQEKIRNCIIDSYTNDGVMAVILGGDSDPNNPPENVIPHRGLYASPYNEDNIPADMYYACLDGNWNNNGNSYWGEPGEEDLFAEIMIGRIAADDATEIEHMTHKLIMYQNEPVVDDIEKALMVGESLDGSTWGGDSKDEVANGSSNHGSVTAGLSDNFTVSELYERDMSWNKNNVFDQFNNTGVNLLNHLGHSNVTYNMKMSNSDLTTDNITNNGISRGYVVGYSQGCYNGSMDSRNSSGWYVNTDCFAEKITTLETAEVATIANSRYGWYSPGTTAGPSQFFDREFFDAIFGEDLTMIGEANGDSKEDNSAIILSNDYYRWCAYELNLFGDPTMDIWTATPTPVTASYDENIPMGTSYIYFETDAPYARVCLMQSDSVIGRDVAGPDGNVSVNLFSPVNTADTISVSIIAHNRTRHQDFIHVITDTPFIVYSSNTVNDSAGGNNNGWVDFGETVKLTVYVMNIGNIDADNVDVYLSSEDPYVTITDSTENYGAIAQGQTASVPDGFEFICASNIPNGHAITFEIRAVDGDTWTDHFDIPAHAPDLATGNYTIVDTAMGNGNGLIEPGETVEVHIETSNTGLSTADTVHGSITTYNSLVTIVNGNDSLDSLPAGTTEKMVYTLSVDPIAHIGMSFDLTNEVISGAYTSEHTYYMKVGLICEDWETGDFSRFNWEHSGGADWEITSSNVFEGNYSACSGAIGGNDSTVLSITLNVLADDSISFYRKVSSESNYDKLAFYIDEHKIDEYSGQVSYERMAFPVAYGTHTFKWVYSKNEHTNQGDDCAWLDYIVLPYTIVPGVNAGENQDICAGDTAFLSGSATNFTDILWTTSGTGQFNDSTLMSPEYYPGEEDIANGMAILTMQASHNLGASRTDDVMLTITSPPATPTTPAGPEYIDLFVTGSSDYTVPAQTDAGSYAWQLSPSEAGNINGSDTIATATWDGSYIGYAYVKTKAYNDCGESMYSDSLEILIDNTVGIDRNTGRESMLSIIPNPFRDQSSIVLDLEPGTLISINIYNSYGKLVRELVREETVNAARKTIMLTMEGYSEGIYYITLKTNKTRITRKIVFIK